MLGNPIGHRQQRSSAGVMGSSIAQENGFGVSATQRQRNRLGLHVGRATERTCNTQFVGKGECHIAQVGQPIGRRRHVGICHGHGPLGRRIDDGVELAAVAHRLADALGEQGVVLAQIGAHDQGAVQAAQIGDRHAQITDTRRGREFGVAQAVVDVVAAQRAHQLGCQVQLFEGAVRTEQCAD